MHFYLVQELGACFFLADRFLGVDAARCFLTDQVDKGKCPDARAAQPIEKHLYFGLDWDAGLLFQGAFEYIFELIRISWHRAYLFIWDVHG